MLITQEKGYSTLTRNIFLEEHAGEHDTHKQLTLHAVALSISFCLITAHISTAQARCPIYRSMVIFNKFGDPFEHSEGKGWTLIIDTETDAWITTNIFCLHRCMPRIEIQCIIGIQVKPDRYYMWASICP